MLGRRLIIFFKDPVWSNLTSFSLVLFFIFLGDAILSYWIPNFLQDSLGNPFLMGITMSFSSFVGFGADLIFPQLLRNYTVRRLISSAIFVSLIFIVNLAVGTSFPKPLIFLIAMAIWGIYYEFVGFATQQYVADSVPSTLHSSGWAMIDIFKNMAYFFGPLLAGLLILKGEYVMLTVVATFVLVGLLILAFSGVKHEKKVSIVVSEVNLWRELSHWKVLFKKVWPIIFISLITGLIDAAFWTTGATWTESLSKESPWGSLILPAYQLPTLFMGIIIIRLKIFKGKKKLAEQFLLLSGLALMLLIFKLPAILYVLIVFISSIFLAVTYPMVEAVYSDITSRMGVERKHLVGLSNSSMSMAYIISPAVAGFLASMVGEKMTFVAIGGISVLTALILLAVTPKKIRLPEKTIETWKD